MKNFEEFQQFIDKVAVYKKTIPQAGWLFYGALGLAGEAGETCEKIKKMYRDNAGIMTDDIRASIVKELGDVLFYVTVVSEIVGSTLEEVATACETKLMRRLANGTLQGSGDDR